MRDVTKMHSGVDYKGPWTLPAPWTHRTRPPRLGKRGGFLRVFHERPQALSGLLHTTMNTLGDGFRDPECPVHASTWPLSPENHDVRLVKKETADKIVAHIPDCGQFLNREMTLKRDAGCWHIYSSKVCRTSSSGVRQMALRTKARDAGR